MKESHKGWHVLYVKSRHEKKVHESLKKISIDSFLPMIKELRKRSDRKIIIEKPLFPSYVFININSSLEFYKALSVDGACVFISFGKEYSKLTEKEINKIKLLINSKDIANVEINALPPKVGEIKTITYGALSGLECEIIRYNHSNKVIVKIDSLKLNITATIPLCYFEEFKVVY